MGYQLVDSFGRKITYVRMSVTDRCDFRCVYCMGEKMTFLPHKNVLTLEELEWLGRAFIELGVTKIRLTGGEPLIRTNILQLFRNLGKLDNLDELVLTTNGSQLVRMAQLLKETGLKRINISLDTLKPERFQRMTKTNKLETVLQGISAAIQANFQNIKLNAVILKNRNHDEVVDLVKFAIERGIDISFIEEMPLGTIDSHNRAEAFYSSNQIRKDLRAVFNLTVSTEITAGPSRYYRIPNTNTKVGFISPHSHNFCDTCNRVRVTTDGYLLLCLGKEHSINLRDIIRQNPNDLEVLKQTIIDSIVYKPEGHNFKLGRELQIMRYMNVTGG
ncbi:GTP 3',8-cyclase MoaA [Thiotrichales bacterium HSG1]|nr:GTP 3',8-cyclase MoaA [Thiotrichales bacterium HSG1]